MHTCIHAACVHTRYMRACRGLVVVFFLLPPILYVQTYMPARIHASMHAYIHTHIHKRVYVIAWFRLCICTGIHVHV